MDSNVSIFKIAAFIIIFGGIAGLNKLKTDVRVQIMDISSEKVMRCVAVQDDPPSIYFRRLGDNKYKMYDRITIQTYSPLGTSFIILGLFGICLAILVKILDRKYPYMFKL